MGSGAGRSGSFFFATKDKRFILKSISKTETTTLMHLLQSYENHINANVNTLLTRFFGLYVALLQSTCHHITHYTYIDRRRLYIYV